jgi:putative phage-type endonuclease
MNALYKLVQGTPEWHEHRAKYRNASETAAVMGISPWQTPYELWLVKTGRKVTVETEAMRHGTATEPAARAAFELESGLIMQPLVMVEGDYSASLDGITLAGDTIVEIKCPYRGQTSELWQTVHTGSVPAHYMLQVQHQLMVSKAKHAYLWVYDGSEGIGLTIEPDVAAFAQIRAAWDVFQPYLDNDTPPPMTDQDTLTRSDYMWEQAAAEYLRLKAMSDEAQTKADEAKAKLIALTAHNREIGYGVSVTRYWKIGNVDYKKVPALVGVDLAPYRSKVREEVRVTVVV